MVEAVLANSLNCGAADGGPSGKLASVAAAQRKGGVERHRVRRAGSIASVRQLRVLIRYGKWVKLISILPTSAPQPFHVNLLHRPALAYLLSGTVPYDPPLGNTAWTNKLDRCSQIIIGMCGGSTHVHTHSLVQRSHTRKLPSSTWL